MAKTYDTYKDSGIAWIGSIPNEWNVEKARNIFKLRNSKGNEIPILLSATQLNGMYPQHLLEGVVLVKQNTDLQTFRTVHKNDFIISLRSFQGGFEMSDYEGVCSPAYQVFYNTKEINHQYFKLLFKSQGFISMINSLVIGIREGKNIQYGSFAYSFLPFPSVEEQEKIANFVNEKCGEIDSLISLQEEMISELQAYKQSVITEAVTKGLDPNVPMKDSGVEWIGMIPEGWNICKLKFLCSSIKDGSHFSPTTTEEGFPYITAADVHGKGLDYANAKKISEKDYNDLVQSGCKAEKDDILLVKDGATTGRVGMKIENNPCVLLSSVAMLRVNTKSYPTYLMYMVSSDLLQQQISIAMAGSAMPRITLTKLNTFIALEVPLSEQQAIASYLDEKTSQIDSLIALKQEKITELKDYKKSIIYEYVTGKKKV